MGLEVTGRKSRSFTAFRMTACGGALDATAARDPSIALGMTG